MGYSKHERYDTSAWCTVCYRGRHEDCTGNRKSRFIKGLSPCGCNICRPQIIV